MLNKVNFGMSEHVNTNDQAEKLDTGTHDFYYRILAGM
jgi:hypothetical protein